MNGVAALKLGVARGLYLATNFGLTASHRLLPPNLFVRVHRFFKATNTRLNWALRRRKIAAIWQKNFLDTTASFYFHVETTNVCNAKCVFCAYPVMERPKTVMKMPLFEKILKEISEQPRRGDLSFVPIVGDPFLDKKLLERVVLAYPLQQVRALEFYTNAIRMRPVVLDALIPYSDKIKIIVSWGGFDAPTWNKIMGVEKFEAARDNLDYLIACNRERGGKFRVTIGLRCPPSACQGPLWDKYKALERQGVLAIRGIDQYDSWAGKISAEALTEVGLTPRPMPHKLGPCKLLYSAPVVLADGRVNACSCRDVEAELVIGDVNTEPFFQIFGGPAHQELIRRQAAGDWPDVCKRCTYYVSTHDNIRTYM